MGWLLFLLGWVGKLVCSVSFSWLLDVVGCWLVAGWLLLAVVGCWLLVGQGVTWWGREGRGKKVVTRTDRKTHRQTDGWTDGQKHMDG